METEKVDAPEVACSADAWSERETDPGKKGTPSRSGREADILQFTPD
jgi:hypothetical protein